MGAGQFINEFYRTVTRKSCYTRRDFYHQILTLFTTFRNIHPLPRHLASDQDIEELKRVVKRIGIAAEYATTTAKKEVQEIETSISLARAALLNYMEIYHPGVSTSKYQEVMASATTQDRRAINLMEIVNKQLAVQLKALKPFSTRNIDLYVCKRGEDHKLENPMLISGKIKIEDNATLNMLMHRYMEYYICPPAVSKPATSNNVGALVLRQNPRIYRTVPLSEGHWEQESPYVRMDESDPTIKCIPSVEEHLTVREYSLSGSSMNIIFDFPESRSQNIKINGKLYQIPEGGTTWWCIKSQSYNAVAALRKSGLDYPLYIRHLLPVPEFPIPMLSTEAEVNDDIWRLKPHSVSHALDSAQVYRQPSPSVHAARTITRPPGNLNLTDASALNGRSSTKPMTSETRPAVSQDVSRPLAWPASSLTPKENATPMVPKTPYTPSHKSRLDPVVASSELPSSPDPSNVFQQPSAPKKVLPGRVKAKTMKAGPDAYRLQHRSSGSPNELIEEDNKRGGWLGSFIKSGLQRFGGYGGNAKP